MNCPSSTSSSKSSETGHALLLRVAILGVTACLAWLMLSAFLGHSPRPEVMDLVDEVVAKQPAILYLGDSSLFSGHPSDTDKRTIPELLQERLHEHAVGQIHKAAFNMDVFLCILRYIQDQEYRPDLLVLPVNLRSYSPVWQARPDWQFVTLKLYLQHDSSVFRAFYEPLAIFKVLNVRPVTVGEYHDALTETLGKASVRLELPNGAPCEFGPDGEPQLNAAQRFAVAYAYPLSPQHPQLKALKEVSELAESMDIPILFYVTPIDMQLGEELVGENLRNVVGQNLEVIQSALKGRHGTFVDLHDAVSAGHFVHNQGEFVEHFKESGRMAIAEALRDCVQASDFIGGK